MTELKLDHFIKRSMRRWWGNLENGIEMTIEMEKMAGNLTEESTIAELLELCKNKLEEFSE